MPFAFLCIAQRFLLCARRVGSEVFFKKNIKKRSKKTPKLPETQEDTTINRKQRKRSKFYFQ